MVKLPLPTRKAASLAMILAFALGTANPVLGQELQSLDDIDRQLVAFTGAEIGQPGGTILPVDRKLRLRMCRSALALAWYGKPRQAVAVTCPDQGGWRIFVPLGHAADSAATPVVKRRDQVRVEARGEGFTIARQGEALEDGAEGDWIRVQLVAPVGQRSRSGPIITAQVLDNGRVMVATRSNNLRVVR